MIPAPTLRSRFILLICLSVIFWFVCSLMLVDRVNNIIAYDHGRQDIAKLRHEASMLFLEAANLKSQFGNLESGSSGRVSNDRIEEVCIRLNTTLSSLIAGKLVSDNLTLQRSIKDAEENVKDVKQLCTEFTGLIYERGDLGTGLLNQWYTRLQSILDLNKNALSPRAEVFIEKLSGIAMSYLINRDPTQLEKLIDYYEFERSISFPVNAAGIENELILNSFFDNTESLLTLYRKAGNNESAGLRAQINFNVLQISDIAVNLEKESEKIYTNGSAKVINRFIWFVLFFGVLSIAAFYRSFVNIYQSVSQLKYFLKELKSGKVPEKLYLNSSDDLNEMAENLNDHVESLNHKIRFADKIGELNIREDFKPLGADDVLGNSLLKMAQRLREAEHEDIIHKTQEEKRRWLSEGIASFGEIFRSERENLEELAFKVIKNLVKYINADQGAIYLNNQEESSPVIDMVAAFAYDRRKYISRRILYGEGLIGTCALEKETMYLTDIPKNYFEISSGIGQAQPRCILIVPLKLENELFGILEIASFRILEPHETGFVEQLGESIANTLAAVRINEKTISLLEKSRKQAEEMARQEEKMVRNVQELRDAQEESLRKETEITGILNAVNSSSLVAEYSTNGRFADVNEKFLFLMESSREQIVGKHHSDFSVVDKYSNEYKEFWRKLKDGETISQTEHFRLFNGNEIWLNQTYTPILDRSGKPYKILNIAHDITQDKKQQESLENQANEIKRSSIEMESLSNAVDASIIKCELSVEGIIADVNTNYIETTGYSGKEVLGKNIRLFLKDTEKQQFEKIWSEITKEKTYSGVIRRTKPTGEEVWLMATFSPVKNEEGEIYKVYFLAHDITEKKLKYQLLEDANKEIERLRQQLHET